MGSVQENGAGSRSQGALSSVATFDFSLCKSRCCERATYPFSISNQKAGQNTQLLSVVLEQQLLLPQGREREGSHVVSPTASCLETVPTLKGSEEPTRSQKKAKLKRQKQGELAGEGM